MKEKKYREKYGFNKNSDNNAEMMVNDERNERIIIMKIKKTND